jgi:cytochrome c peroxidase
MKQYRVSWTAPADNVPMDVPTLVEIWRTAPYLYDGRSYTVRDLLDVHRPEDRLTPSELDDLAKYVLSL